MCSKLSLFKTNPAQQNTNLVTLVDFFILQIRRDNKTKLNSVHDKTIIQFSIFRLGYYNYIYSFKT